MVQALAKSTPSHLRIAIHHQNQNSQPSLTPPLRASRLCIKSSRHAHEHGSRSMSHLQTPLQPPTALAPGYGYLSASAGTRQPLCGSSEGWGPISEHRYDFTPCFLDVGVASVAAAGILGGAGAAWYLLRRCTAQPVKKNWHFYAKLVRYGRGL